MGRLVLNHSTNIEGLIPILQKLALDININDLNLMIFQIGWAALAAIFTFSIAMVVWGRNGDGSIDI